ncbi:MAG: hypothetical protein C0622_10800 [Desulfuromonas sp.]|nr:MAG: hypothetical protein C0622_10800 [Desulfuromonas sp.]
MALILDSSEINYAISLASKLIGKEPKPAVKTAEKEVETAPLAAVVAAPTEVARPPVDLTNLKYRGDRLHRVIEDMCQRSGFLGAVIADNHGLPLAVVNPPVNEDALSAFTTVLGEALHRAGTLLGQHGAEYLAIDINYEDKIVLRRFFINDAVNYLMVICPQEVDERSEIELSIDQISSILTGADQD